jgi:riboflavin kinase / FMN adenylyltransferase
MEVFRGFVQTKRALAGCAVALGNFDGVHRGHQALFSAVIARAQANGKPAVAATFDPHPGKVLFPDLAPKLLTPLSLKLDLMEAMGLDAVVLQSFDRSYAALTAEEFLARDLFGGLAPDVVVVGPDFTYGSGRSGDAATLRAACGERSVSFFQHPPVTVDGGGVVSSTKIREFVAEGRVAAAALLLGRPFDLVGTVVRGFGRGRTLGFPTANLQPENEVCPGFGVYAVRAFVGSDVWGGAVNIGRKPTFGDEDVSIEAFLFGFQGDLYGRRVALEFIERLRGEQRFGSVNELTAAIARDCEQARSLLERLAPPDRLSPFPRERGFTGK